VGHHPQRSLFVDPARLDLRWQDAAAARSAAGGGGAAGSDLCGSARGARPVYGAFADFAACLRAPDTRAHAM
jgi:hypothetical protein